MTPYDHVVQLASELSPLEKTRLIQHLSTALAHDLETKTHRGMSWDELNEKPHAEVTEQQTDEMGYPIGYFEETYGSMADDPIERNQPLYPDVRDEIE